MRSDIAMTDGGIETVLIFHNGFDLPSFAAFPLLETPAGREALTRYYDSFLDLAEQRGLPFVLDTPTWRANPDWGDRLGYSRAALATANTSAVEFVGGLAQRRSGTLIEGMLGPRGDGYVIDRRMEADEAAEYHAAQIGWLCDAGVERIAVLTLTYPAEAVGVVRAAVDRGVPSVISFTVETDGRLPDGSTLGDAIAEVDAATSGAAEFFMVNCAHPEHVAAGLAAGGSDRVGGLRFNASRLSHAELDAAEELDEGDPAALGRDAAALRTALPGVRVLGGCCGTDARHVRAVVDAW